MLPPLPARWRPPTAPCGSAGARRLHQHESIPMNSGSTHQPPTGTARIADLFGVAARHHQEGRLAEAEACYRRVLAAEPGNADALNMLGIVALQSGRGDAAVEMIRQAIANNATNPVYFYNLGIALR